MTIYQQPREKENALSTRRAHADLAAEKNAKRCIDGFGDFENNDSYWPIDNDDEENLHNDTAPMESKENHAAQVVLHRRNSNRHGKATCRVTGQTINADSHTYHSSSVTLPSSSSYNRRLSIQRSVAAKRRKIIIYTAIAIALLGYFFEMIQLIRRMGSDGASQQDMIIDLPNSISLPNKFKPNKNASNVESYVVPSVASKNVVIPNKEEWDRVKAITNSRAEQRRKRSRPPNLLTNNAEAEHNVPVSTINAEIYAPQISLDLPVHRSLNESIEKTYLSTRKKNNIRSNTQQSTVPTICGIHAHDASKKDSTNYPSSAYIGPQSRVIVTGALSQLGMEIILQLYKDCGTEYILGIDSLLPNTRHDRLAALERCRFLYHHVPSFQKLQVPIFGIAPHPKLENELRLESIGREFDIIDRFNPTHIVHLMGFEEGRGENSDFGDINDVSPYSGGHGSMMRRYQNLVSMDQILASIARFKRDQGSKVQPQLVYVSSSEVEDQSGVTLVGKMKGKLGKASAYGSCSLLKEVLASYYHRHHGVESVGIRLSTIYGPFARPGSLVHDLAERTVHSAAGKNGDRGALDTIWKRREGAEVGVLEQITYVGDLAQAFVTAMQFRGDRTHGPALIQLGSKDAISMKELERRMSEPDQLKEETSETSKGWIPTLNGLSISDSDMERNLHFLGWWHATEIQDGLRSMLDWQIMKAYPFAKPISLPITKEFMDASQASYVGFSTTLPCASGCSWHGKCTSSVWDTVIEESRAATANCKYVLYTVDLSSDLVELKVNSASSKGEKDFCHIVFISSTSVLADQGNSQWTIITINGNESTVTEAELSLAKLSPSMLFGDKVTHAFYFNHRKLKVGTDNAKIAIQMMNMKSVKTKTRTILRDRKFWLLPRSKRHSIMSTSRLATPKGHDINSASENARFVMSNFDVKMTEQVQKQIQFYQHASHLVRNSLLRSPNYAGNLIENHFPFEYIRSNWLIHYLKSDEGHQLRCEIYEEHATWGNQNMEDFSMAFVLAKRKVMTQLGNKVETPDSPLDWHPLLVPKETKEMDEIVAEGPEYLEYLDPSRKSVAKRPKGSEIFISFLAHELTSKNEK